MKKLLSMMAVALFALVLCGCQEKAPKDVACDAMTCMKNKDYEGYVKLSINGGTFNLNGARGFSSVNNSTTDTYQSFANGTVNDVSAGQSFIAGYSSGKI